MGTYLPQGAYMTKDIFESAVTCKSPAELDSPNKQAEEADAAQQAAAKSEVSEHKVVGDLQGFAGARHHWGARY